MLQIVQAVLEPAADRPAVIIDGRPEHIQLRAVTRHEDIPALVTQAVQRPRLGIELRLETLALHDSATRPGHHGFQGTCRHRPLLHLEWSGRLHEELVLAGRIALLRPREILRQAIPDVQETFLPLRQRARRHRAHRLRTGLQHARLESTAVHRLPIRDQLPMGRVRAGLVIIAVEKFQPRRIPVIADQRSIKGLIDLLHFEILRLRTAVAIEQSVHHELPVIRLVAEIATRRQILHALRRVIPQRLVHPVPDRTAHEEVRRIDALPILGEIAQGVAHRMGEFIDVVRILDIRLAGRDMLHPRHGRILAAADVGIIVVALILDGTHRVQGPRRGKGRLEILARSRLVAHAPDQHARMIVVGNDHLRHARHMRVLPRGIVRQGSLPIMIMVTLDIRLVHEVDAILVAEPIPVRGVRIMRIADVVDVGAFHQADVLLHHLPRDRVAHRRLRLVTVDATQLDRLSVQIEVAARQAEFILRSRRIADGHLAETHDGGEHIQRRAGSVFQFSDQGIAMRGLGRPRLGLRIVQDRGKPHPIETRNQLIPILIQRMLIEPVIQRLSWRRACDFGLYGKRLQRRRHADIPYRNHRLRLQGDRPEDARQTEHILHFQIARVGEAVHLHCQHILPRLDQRSDIELRKVARILREAHIAPVDPEVEERIHALEIDQDPLPVPVRRDLETAAVGADLVARPVHGPVFRRRAHDAQPPVPRLPLEEPGHVDIDINRRPIALGAILSDADDIPVGRDRDLLPSGIVIVRLVEIGRPRRRIRRPMELPVPVQAQPVSTAVRQDGPGRFDIREREKPGVRGLFIQGQTVGRLPFVSGGCCLRTRCESGKKRQQKEEKSIHTE